MLCISPCDTAVRELTFSNSELNDAEQSHDHDEEHDAHSDGSLAENLVQSAGFALAEEGVGATGDCTGEALVLAGLHENRHDQAKRNNAKHEGQNNLNRSH